jgi:hypothetical protein
MLLTNMQTPQDSVSRHQTSQRSGICLAKKTGTNACVVAVTIKMIPNAIFRSMVHIWKQQEITVKLHRHKMHMSGTWAHLARHPDRPSLLHWLAPEDPWFPRASPFLLCRSKASSAERGCKSTDMRRVRRHNGDESDPRSIEAREVVCAWTRSLLGTGVTFPSISMRMEPEQEQNLLC